MAVESPAPTGVEGAQRSWHALPTEVLARALVVDTAAGLGDDVARSRLEEAGPNLLPSSSSRSPLALLVDQFRNLLVVVLVAAAVLAAAVGQLKDAVVIAVVLSLNAGLGFVQEYRAERSLAALAALLVPTARVRRGSIVRDVPGTGWWRWAWPARCSWWRNCSSW